MFIIFMKKKLNIESQFITFVVDVLLNITNDMHANSSTVYFFTYCYNPHLSLQLK